MGNLKKPNVQGQPQNENLKKFAQEWSKDENLQREFQKNPEKVCSQYHLSGKEKDTIMKIAKEGKNLKERITTAVGRLIKQW